VNQPKSCTTPTAPSAGLRSIIIAAMPKKSDLAIRFDDLNSDALTAWKITSDQAARRLYVEHEGQLYSGIPAFIVLWQEMPRYRFLARVVSLPGLHWLAIKTYDLALAPAIYRWHRIRQRCR
jgi:predicted DCC family thiol-disulfide oxidoreductase YuxK